MYLKNNVPFFPKSSPVLQGWIFYGILFKRLNLNDCSLMTLYESHIAAEMAVWQQRMQKAPSFSSQLAKRFQNRLNRAIPEKIHKAITLAIKQMTRAVFFGAGFTTRP